MTRTRASAALRRYLAADNRRIDRFLRRAFTLIAALAGFAMLVVWQHG